MRCYWHATSIIRKHMMTEPTYVTQRALRAPSGRLVVIEKLERRALVCCETYSDALYTIDHIVSEALYAGIACTRPQACAAAFSVPDGAPIAMALDNLGCALSEAAAEKMEAWGKNARRLDRKYGPRCY